MIRRWAAVGGYRTSVDLYTYTSMLLATTQVQAAQIAELEARLGRADGPPFNERSIVPTAAPPHRRSGVESMLHG
jgi:hypothetical protein